MNNSRRSRFIQLVNWIGYIFFIGIIGLATSTAAATLDTLKSYIGYTHGDIHYEDGARKNIESCPEELKAFNPLLKVKR